MTTAEYLTNLRTVYQRATREDKRAGRAWYPSARGELFALAKRYRYSLKRAAYAAAALSNNMEWRANLELLEHVAAAVRYGQQPRGHYVPCLRKAVAILRRGDWRALRGPKVRPFAAALYGDTTAAVVDRHMARAAGLVGYLTDKRHRDIAAALRMLAREMRERVADVQAIVWLVQRRGDDVAQLTLN